MISRDLRVLPTLNIKREVKDIDDFKFEDFEIVGYNPHPTIKSEMAV
jgi:thymidylate synthase